MDTTATYICPYCGQASVTEVDVSQGYRQRYIEDCQICCRPMTLFLSFEEDTLEATIETEPRE